MDIYEIDQQIRSLIDPETGEIMDFECFEQLNMLRNDKVENLALWYKNICAEAAAIKAEADILLKRGRRLDSQSERLREYIAMILDGEKFSTPRCSVTFRKSSSLDVPNPNEVIDWAQRTGHLACIRQKPPELEKKAVSELLKSGVEVPGAEIKTQNNVTIR